MDTEVSPTEEETEAPRVTPSIEVRERLQLVKLPNKPPILNLFKSPFLKSTSLNLSLKRQAMPERTLSETLSILESKLPSEQPSLLTSLECF